MFNLCLRNLFHTSVTSHHSGPEIKKHFYIRLLFTFYSQFWCPLLKMIWSYRNSRSPIYCMNLTVYLPSALIITIDLHSDPSSPKRWIRDASVIRSRLSDSWAGIPRISSTLKKSKTDNIWQNIKLIKVWGNANMRSNTENLVLSMNRYLCPTLSLIHVLNQGYNFFPAGFFLTLPHLLVPLHCRPFIVVSYYL